METDKTKGDSSPLVEYRLTQIEKTLAEMKQILENARTADSTIGRDIAEIRNVYAELKNAYNSHDKRIRVLEEAPLKAKADRWQQVADLIFKMAATAAIVGVFAKIGLQGV